MTGSTKRAPDPRGPETQEPEPELAFLEPLRGGPEEELDPAELAAMFGDVREQVEESRVRRIARLSEQPTARRRLFALLTFALIALGAGTLSPRPDLGAFPPLVLAVILGGLGVLMALAVVVAFRPIHVPALAPVWKVGLCVAAVCLAFAIAVAPGLHDHVIIRPTTPTPWGHALPCLGFGLLAGLPGYALLRILDRGAPFGRVLAAAAAGLSANMVLELHCPIGGAEHLVLGHAMVMLVFIVGVVALERWVIRRRNDG